MTSQGFAACHSGGTTSMFSRNAFHESLLIIQHTYIVLHTLSDLLMWITMASVFDFVFFSWDSLRVMLILGVRLEKYIRSIRPSRIYFTTFGSINYPSCSYYQASRLDFFVFLGSQVTKVDSKRKLQKQMWSRIYRMWFMWWMFFCRSTTSNEKRKYCNGWVSSKILGLTFVVFSLCLAITCLPFAIYRSIGS